MMLKKTVLICNGVLFLWLGLAAFQDFRWLNGLRIEVTPRKETCVVRPDRRTPQKAAEMRPLFGVPQEVEKYAKAGGESKGGKTSLQTGNRVIRVEGLSSVSGRRMALIEISAKQSQKGPAREVKKVREGSQVLNFKVVRISDREIVFENMESGEQVPLVIFRKNNTMES